MRNKINHFLFGSLIAVCIVCVGVFITLAAYLNRQNEETITQLGNIYMSSLAERISMHFESITDHRLVQMKTMTESIPPEYSADKESLTDWLLYNGQSRGYEALAYCGSDGTLEMVYGGQIEFSSDTAFLQTIESGTGGIAVGFGGDGERVALVYVPVSLDIPGTEGCVALVGQLPLSYIAETLSLEDDDTLVYSFVIRRDGNFVVRNSAAFRDNYFDRVLAIYEEVDGQTPEEYVAELQAAMEAGTDYSTMIQFEGERRHMYCSSLPNSVWYLVTLMPYGALNESVETLGTRSLTAAMICCAVILAVLLVVFLRYFGLNRMHLK